MSYGKIEKELLNNISSKITKQELDISMHSITPAFIKKNPEFETLKEFFNAKQ